MNKRFISVGAALLVGLSLLTGCGNLMNPSGAVSSETAATLGPYANNTVGVCIYQLNDNFMSLFCDELVGYLVSKGFSEENIKVYNSANNQSVQLSQVEELISRDVDVMIVNPVNSAICSTITQMAVDSETPLVYINREPGADEESKWEDYDLNVTYVGCDARQSGIYQGELLQTLGEDVLDINKDGRIQYFMIEGAPENIDAEYRTMYSLSTLKNSGFIMDCLLDEVGNWDMSTAKLITAKGLSEGLMPEVVIANNDAMALGAISALSDAGLKPGSDVFVVGVDALSEAIDKISAGEMVGTVFNDYISQSHYAADAAIKYLSGEKNEHYIGCEYIKVDSSNADTILSLVQGKSTRLSEK